MTEKQKQAIRILNSMHERKFADDEEYFLLLDFVVGQSPIIMPFQNEPYKPIICEKPFWDDGITCTEPTMQGKSASSITESVKANEDVMSYGDRLIKEGRSPL